MFDLNFLNRMSFFESLRQLFVQEVPPEKTMMEKAMDKVMYITLWIKITILDVAENCYRTLLNPFVLHMGRVVFEVFSEIFTYIILGICCILIALLIHGLNALREATNPSSRKIYNEEVYPVGDEPPKTMNKDDD